MLSEVATGKRGGKEVALVDVRKAYINAPARRRVFVELPPEDYQAGDEDTCGLLQYSLHGTLVVAQHWEAEPASTLGGLMLTKRIACPCGWQVCIKGEHIVATVHGDEITIGGERSAVPGTHRWWHHEIQSTCCANQLLPTRPTRSQVRVNAGMLCDGKPLSA